MRARYRVYACDQEIKWQKCRPPFPERFWILQFQFVISQNVDISLCSKTNMFMVQICILAANLRMKTKLCRSPCIEACVQRKSHAGAVAWILCLANILFHILRGRNIFTNSRENQLVHISRIPILNEYDLQWISQRALSIMHTGMLTSLIACWGGCYFVFNKQSAFLSVRSKSRMKEFWIAVIYSSACSVNGFQQIH